MADNTYREQDGGSPFLRHAIKFYKLFCRRAKNPKKCFEDFLFSVDSIDSERLRDQNKKINK